MGKKLIMNQRQFWKAAAGCITIASLVGFAGPELFNSKVPGVLLAGVVAYLLAIPVAFVTVWPAIKKIFRRGK